MASIDAESFSLKAWAEQRKPSVLRVSCRMLINEGSVTPKTVQAVATATEYPSTLDITVEDTVCSAQLGRSFLPAGSFRMVLKVLWG